MNDYQRACELKEETIANRRYIHEHAEVGLELPQTRAYVMEKLKEYGLEPKVCGAGVTATLGKAGKDPVTQGRTWMRFRCRRRAVRALHAKTGFTTMPVAMIFMQRCF